MSLAQVMKADGSTVKFRPIYVGLKGDWPYIRKVAKLKSGFQATLPRKCHLCAVEDPCNGI